MKNQIVQIYEPAEQRPIGKGKERREEDNYTCMQVREVREKQAIV